MGLIRHIGSVHLYSEHGAAPCCCSEKVCSWNEARSLPEELVSVTCESKGKGEISHLKTQKAQ